MDTKHARTWLLSRLRNTFLIFFNEQCSMTFSGTSNCYKKQIKPLQIAHTYMELLRMSFLLQAPFWCAPTVSNKEECSNVNEFILFMPHCNWGRNIINLFHIDYFFSSSGGSSVHRFDPINRMAQWLPGHCTKLEVNKSVKTWCESSPSS